jgi:hypothetical protein
MLGMFALHSLSCHILFMPCILFEEPFILSLICSLVVLRNFYSYYLGMIEKAHNAATFLSCYFQTSLPEVMFALTIHARRSLCIYFHLACFFSFFCFIYFQKKKKKKKKGEKMRNFFIFPFDSFLDIACIFA